jgi:hypothetical protein
MHLKVDGNALVAGLFPLRKKRQLPQATITASAAAMGKVAEIRCGAVQFTISVFDRRSWSGVVEFDGAVLKALAMLPGNDLFMDVCRVEYIAGRIVFADNLSAPATYQQL